MYSQEALTILENRIGWDQPLDANSDVVLNETTSTGASAREFTNFHQLCSVENIYAAVAAVDMDMAEFNAYLISVRSQAVVAVLNEALEKRVEYEYDNDYSDLIITRAPIFDDAIGYTVAIRMLELFVSSNRRNLTERNSSLSYQNLKVELEGAKNDAGFYVAKGILVKRYYSIRSISRAVFIGPTAITGSTGWV